MQQVIESVESGEAEIGFVMSNNVQVKELKHMLHFKNLVFNPLGVDTWYANVGPKDVYKRQGQCQQLPAPPPRRAPLHRGWR